MITLGLTLRVAAARLAPALAAPDAISTLAGLLDDLPAAPRALLECRLRGRDRGVDLSLCTLPSDLDESAGLGPRAPRIRAWLSRAAPEAASRALSSLHDAWRDLESPASRHVTRAWLEVDVSSPRPPETPAPTAIFLGLSDGAGSRRGGAARARSLLPFLPAGTAEAVDPGLLRRVFSSLPRGAQVTFLGAWAGREGPCLRVNVAGLPPGATAGYLAALGWRDERGAAARAAAELERCGASLVLCLDVGADIHPRIGLEAMIDDGRLDASSFRPLLDALVDHHLCTRERRQAVLRWHGISDPAADDWPVELVAESLLAGPAETPVLFRHLNHLKVAIEPGGRLHAKAYLAFGLVTADVTRRPARDVRRSS